MALHKKSYDIKQETWQTQDQFRDRHLMQMVNPGLAAAGKVVARMPEMEGGTVVAFLPYPVGFDARTGLPAWDQGRPSEPQVLADRWDESPDNPRTYNWWMFRAGDRGVTRFGKNWLSLIFDNPDDSGWDFDRDHPIQLIHRTTSFAVRKGVPVDTPYGSSESDKWEELLKGSKDRSVFPSIKRPEFLFLTYAIVYASGKTRYQDETGVPYGAAKNDPLVLFVMSRATAEALMTELDKPKDNADPKAGLLHPNVTGCKFVHFYDKQGPCPTVRVTRPQVEADDGGFGARRGPSVRMGEAGAGDGYGYAVQITNTLDGTESTKRLDRTATSKFALQRVRPWVDTVHGTPPDECAELVQAQADLPLSVLSYAWQTHPEYINSVTRARMAARVTSAPPRAPVSQPHRGSVTEDAPFAVPTTITSARAPAPPADQPVHAAPSGPPALGAGDGPGDGAGVFDLIDSRLAQEGADRLRRAAAGVATAAVPAPGTGAPPVFRRPGA